MSEQPAGSKTSEQTPVTTSTNASPATRDQLATDDGQISVAQGVVQKIAGKACQEIARGARDGHQRRPRVRLGP